LSEKRLRKAAVRTKTKETQISASVNIDGSGKCNASTSIKFLDHMLLSFATHSLIDIEIQATGDLAHHIVEDTALALGKCISEALGDRSKINRFASAFVPMDESLAFASLDLVKRRYFVLTNFELKRNAVEDLAKEDASHFFHSLCDSLQCTMHLRIEYGSNDHHKLEALFKALALSLRSASEIDPRRQAVASSKGSM
jgi:imidazoleglycerol-phosphate dehydratase